MDYMTFNNGTGTAINSDVEYVINIKSDTGSGTKSVVKIKKDEGGLHPSLVIKYVKSKLNKSELKKLEKNAKILCKFVEESGEMRQQALYEELSKKLLSCVKFIELNVCGFSSFVAVSDVEKFKYNVRGKVLKFGKFTEYPRPIPLAIRNKIKAIQKKSLFNELWILYLDYSGEKLKTNKEKIREKDPILFGKVNEIPDQLFYLLDWVDECCDLTLDKFLAEMRDSNKDYDIKNLPEIDEKFLENLAKEVSDREDRLNKTNAGNYRDLMDKEDIVNKKKCRWKFWKKG